MIKASIKNYITILVELILFHQSGEINYDQLIIQSVIEGKMKLKTLIVVAVMGLIVGSAKAQDCGFETCTPTPTSTPTETPTPTITPTPTATFTPTPDTVLYWTLPAPAITPDGTTTPEARGQAVALRYETDAGQVVTNILLFAILVTKWAQMLLGFFKGGQQ
jgi:hypothetical protein